MQKRKIQSPWHRGFPASVKVNQTLEPNVGIERAIKAWKRYQKDSGIMDEIRERQQYTKPSIKKREMLKKAKRAQYFQTLIERNS